MKAIRLAATGGIDRARLVDLPDPGEPGHGAIRVRIRASSLNYHDYRVVAADRPGTEGLIPMADGAGAVEAVGAGVTGFAVGDMVVSTFFPPWLDGAPPYGDFATVPGDGVDGYAVETVVRPATWFTRAPAGWSAVEAATITTAGLTAWRALVEDGACKPGDTVLTLGTGGVSLYALQIAKGIGARVAVTSSSDAKLARLRALGADFTVNYRSEPDWGLRVRDWTGGRGVDQVIELGGPGTLAQSIRAVRVGGQISLIGTVTGRAGEVPTAEMMVKQVRLQGVVVGSRRHQLDMVRGMETLGFRPVIDSRFPLAALGDAFRHEESGVHFGKIALEI